MTGTGLFGLGRFSLETFWSDYEILQKSYMNADFFSRCFRNPIRVPRIENRVSRITGN